MVIQNRTAAIQLAVSAAVRSTLHRPVQIHGMLLQNVPSAPVITPQIIKAALFTRIYNIVTNQKRAIFCRIILVIRKMYRLVIQWLSPQHFHQTRPKPTLKLPPVLPLITQSLLLYQK